MTAFAARAGRPDYPERPCPFVDYPVAPSSAQIDVLHAANVPVSAWACDPGEYGFAIGAGQVEFVGHRFEFADGGGEPAFMVIARDANGEAVDIVAFEGDRIASHRGRVPLLGWHHVGTGDGPLAVHRSVMDWLRAGRRGVVLVDHAWAAEILAQAGPLCASDVAHGDELDRLMTRRPEIMVRSPGRLAA